MSNISRGFAYEREVKKHFVDAGWGCTRAAHSASAMDLIAFSKLKGPKSYAVLLFENHGYHVTISKARSIPLKWLASKIEEKYIKHTYYEQINPVYRREWRVVLMQCKIRKR